MRKVFISILVVFASGLLLSAQQIRVTSKPDTSVILIGDQIGFTVTAELPSGVSADMSSVADTLAGKIIVLRRAPRDTSVSANGSITITDRYLITSYDTGSYTIPPFWAGVASGDSLLRFFSDYSFLDVIRPDIAPSDTTDVIFDIVGPRGAPVTFREVLPWIVITLIVAVIVWLLARFLPRNPLKRFIRPPAPPEPAHVIALRDLEALRNEELWQKGEIKEYYSRLSDILRRYIDNRYGISSPELTTDETVRMLQKASVTTVGQMAMVKELLSLSDMVKFAKYLPDSTAHESSIDSAVRFVEETRLPDAAPADVSDKADKTANEGSGSSVAGGEKEKGGHHA
jgi:hypothetical protein